MINGTVLLAGGGILLLAGIDKTAEAYGIYWVGSVIKVLLPVAGLAAAALFGDSSIVRGLLQ